MTISYIGKTLQQIGYANLLWNRIEECWYLIFTCLLPTTPRPVVDALFRSVDTGNKQRVLVLRVASEFWLADSPSLTVLKQFQTRTNDAASKRNSLMHADFHIAIEDDIADIRVSRGGDRGKENALAFKPLNEELSSFILTLRQLDKDMDSLRITMSGIKGLPLGPSLPDLIDNYLQAESAASNKRP